MSRRILVGLSAEKPSCLLIVFVLLALVDVGVTTNAQTETTLYSFAGYPGDGYFPDAGLIQASDGNFYGMTGNGGANGCDCGTVFLISPSGIYTNFGAVRVRPQGGLVQGSDGNFYGTTFLGGTYNVGSVFRISSSGSETNLYSFSNNPYLNDGQRPQAGLVQGSDGNFYGTTPLGGVSDDGTVFRITPGGSYTNLYSFAGFTVFRTDGAQPMAGLVQGSDGNFYGTTFLGGRYNIGTVFRISPGGTETNLYSFGTSPNDGAGPQAALVQGSDGNFYGTTYLGGTNNEGTVFRINPSGTETTLYSFAGYPNDGSHPLAGLVQGSDGNFYGTTVSGGTSTNYNSVCDCYGLGTVFQISPSGTYTSLYSFGTYPNDGAGPRAGLVQGSDGNFYGTTYFGGTNNEGTVFKLTLPLAPPPWPINQITGIQPSGSDMVFNVVSIAYETYQLQFTTDLTSGIWSNIPGVSVTNSIGALLTLTNSGGATGPQGFYRFAITP